MSCSDHDNPCDNPENVGKKYPSVEAPFSFIECMRGGECRLQPCSPEGTKFSYPDQMCIVPGKVPQPTQNPTAKPTAKPTEHQQTTPGQATVFTTSKPITQLRIIPKPREQLTIAPKTTTPKPTTQLSTTPESTEVTTAPPSHKRKCFSKS